MTSILQDVKTRGEMCFWATRYDCFADDEEYRLGVDTIRRLLPEVEKELPADRRVAQDFDWKLIEGNLNLPYPYIVSFSARPDNEYMWSKYAKEDGVVLEIDDSVFVPNTEMTMMMTKPCLYAGLMNDEDLTKCIKDEYTLAGLAMLKGPKSKDAFELLERHPKAFVRLIAMYLLSFVATRIKGEKYHWEEETRVIIQTQRPEMVVFVRHNTEIIRDVLHLNPEVLAQTMQQEKMRQRDDKTIFYRECHLPISLLRAVYTRPEQQKLVEDAICKLVQREIPIYVINS